MIHIIAAIARNGVIGNKGQLPWRLPADLRRFRQLTMGQTLVMGRRTFESIGRALPGRMTVVLSRGSFQPPEGVLVRESLEEALSDDGPRAHVFIAGGAEVYARAMRRAARLHLTRIDEDFEGDVFFPEWDEADYRLAMEERPEDAEVSFSYRFQTWVRK